ncbi:MAG: amidase [Nakamurella sp.]
MDHLRQLGAAFRAGNLTPTDHVSGVLDQLAADPFNTVVTLDPEGALAAADGLTRELADGDWRGPLHGIAVGVKDLIDVAGLPTKCGSLVLADAPPAGSDADIVARLKAAGAIIVAKMHTQEFAHGPTGDRAATGPAHNPHDPTRITGGSSSGSAAAIAAGYLPLAVGSDTGGSIRIPAALCGVVGFKPAFGRLSTKGVFPLAESFDTVGLLTADAMDALVAWEVLTSTEPGGSKPEVGPPASLEGLRVGVPVGDYWEPVDPAISASLAATLAAVDKHGASVTQVRTPMIEELTATYPVIVGGESFATHAKWLAERPGDYQPLIRQRLRGFAEQPAIEYIQALRTRRRLAVAFAQAVGDVDVLLLPTTRLRATPIGAESVQFDGADIPVRPALLALTMPFNLLGWPAVSIPAPVAGLPSGLQIVGVRRQERGMLEVAAAIQRAISG